MHPADTPKNANNTPLQLRVGIVQQANTDNKTTNLQATENATRKLAEQGAQLVLLQELHATRYFCQSENVDYFDLAEPISGPTCNRLSTLAKTLGVVIVGSIFEKRAKGIYHNTAVVLEANGELAGFYRKMHIPDDPGFYEKFYFTPGDYAPHAHDRGQADTAGFSVIPTSVGKLGVLVCWDQWFPEAARLMALQGADILLYPTAIGWDPNDNVEEQGRQRDAWLTVQRAHAIANNLPVVVSNRIGYEDDPTEATAGIQFWGNSFICGQQGEILAQMDHKQPSELVATIDMERTEKLRRIWPYFRDRRVDAYNGLEKRWLDKS